MTDKDRLAERLCGGVNELIMGVRVTESPAGKIRLVLPAGAVLMLQHLSRDAAALQRLLRPRKAVTNAG